MPVFCELAASCGSWSGREETIYVLLQRAQGRARSSPVAPWSSRVPSSSSRADDERVGFGINPGCAGRCPAWRHGHADQQDAGQRPNGRDRRSRGRFVFPIVRPDTYSLKVTLQGFKTLEQTNVVVNANDKLSAGILPMEVGAMTEEVSVTARVTEVQSNTGERSFTLESEALKNIANNGRMLFNFATLVPGALSQNTGGRSSARSAASPLTASARTPTTSRSTASPTSTPATTAATWRRPTSTPSPSSRS